MQGLTTQTKRKRMSKHGSLLKQVGPHHGTTTRLSSRPCPAGCEKKKKKRKITKEAKTLPILIKENRALSAKLTRAKGMQYSTKK
eukprot:1155613-Pelagomonas_calceolata.AAC.2